MSNLPVREMVLYKHGVGFFVREGNVEGTSATLTFRADEVNDILKSLAVFDKAGGQVYGVHYQTPMDKAHRLANTLISLSDVSSATQLIQQLRGRNATLLIANADEQEITYQGRVIGIDRKQHNNGQRDFITIKLTDGMVRVFPFDSLRGIRIQDEQSEQDLSYFLDTSMSEDNRRGVTVRMSEGEHELVVYYVAPSPTWRVSYRLVAESDKDGTTGTALLQGWGLFDNRLEEDLENVKVTLVAGQPISFIYDLYESKIPERPTVKDINRVVQRPVEYNSTRNVELELEERRSRLLGNSGNHSSVSGGKRVMTKTLKSMDKLESGGDQEIEGLLDSIYSSIDQEDARAEMASRSLSDAISNIKPNVEAGAIGSTFQYSVTTPVSVKRGESALVPIINEKIPYQRELLYNKSKLPNHPVVSIRFENQSGLTLERGPVTVIVDNDYAGEAIVPFVGDKRTVYIPYAVELGILVKENTTSSSAVHKLVIDGEYLYEQEHLNRTTCYTIENSTDTDKVVTIEASISPQYELFDTPTADIELLNERRWHVDVRAQEQVEFVVNERRVKWSRQLITTLHALHIANYTNNQYLDKLLVDDLSELVTTMMSIKKIEREIDDLTVEKGELRIKQEEYRRNMQALGTTGKEGTLRLRVVDQLEASQNRLEAIDDEVGDLKAKIEETETQVDAMITELGEKYPSDDENNAI